MAEYERGEGRDPSLLLALIERLPDTSMTAALMAGGRSFFGWGKDRAIAADTFDAVNLGTRATGNWKKGQVPDIPSYPRPSMEKLEKATRTPIGIQNIYARFTRSLSST